MDAEEYLQQTEDAVKIFISSYVQYEKMLDGITYPTKATNLIQKNLEIAEEYFGYKFSQATICGAILQVAFMGIERFSTNTEIPKDYEQIIDIGNSKSIKFCVGRRVQNIPIGLLIYSGRNQYNHWDDKTFNNLTRYIFTALVRAYYDDMSFDMAYELDYPERTIKAHHIVLHELGWFDYDSYLRDMKELIL